MRQFDLEMEYEATKDFFLVTKNALNYRYRKSSQALPVILINDA